MQLLLELFDRSVYYLTGTQPAVFYIADKEGGGILINTPKFDEKLLAGLQAILPLKFIFFPSHLGAQDVSEWRQSSGAQTIAYGHEAQRIAVVGAGNGYCQYFCDDQLSRSKNFKDYKRR